PLGWEPPQLDSHVAEKFRLQKIFDQVGALQMNQTVLMVLYKDQRPANALTNDAPGNPSAQ
ncbi:MAG: hypothetical protein ACKVHP_08695, partial [Verrucomicrobiales bacterium]